MARKTITISDKAYMALTRSKKDNESFTEVIPRLTSGRNGAASLLRYLEASPPDEELARSVEMVMQRTRNADS